MVKLTTPVIPEKTSFSLRLEDKVVVLGSCLCDHLGAQLRDAGFDVMVNPFGTLYNPKSVENAINRLESGRPFGKEDCVEMGAGAGLVCSFEHYTKFARPSADEFLAGANDALQHARHFWKEASRVIVVLSTAMVWEHGGRVVANCLKRPAAEFTRRMLSPSEVAGSLEALTAAHPEKQFLTMVCPIRQMSDPRENTLSKATLHLGLEAAGVPYFPAYEIVHDELRDYRFYADDLVHPSPVALQILWERLLGAVGDSAQFGQIEANEKESKAARHRNILCQKN